MAGGPRLSYLAPAAPTGGTSAGQGGDIINNINIHPGAVQIGGTADAATFNTAGIILSDRIIDQIDRRLGDRYRVRRRGTK